MSCEQCAVFQAAKDKAETIAQKIALELFMAKEEIKKLEKEINK